VLFGVGLVLGAECGGFAQILAKAADRLLAVAVLLETARLIENVVDVLGVYE
jgi:hypothetical protein